MVGVGLLQEMSEEIYGERQATAVLYVDDPIQVEKRGNGYVLRMKLPFIAGGDLDVHRRGEELVVRVGPYKRNLLLPQTLKRLSVRGASLVDEHLEIAFERPPDGEPMEGAAR
jgi:arsenite-transporting ATPase